MADFTKIEWTEATWNIITGCSVISPGCAGCYAMKLAGSRLQHHPSRAGLTMPSKAGPVWNGQVRFNEEWLTQPLQWKRPRMIFVCAHGDLFHESVPDAWIDRVFAVMALAPQHTFQVLTKRSARMREYFAARTSGDPWAEAADYIADLLCVNVHPPVLEPSDIPLRNVWLGVSVEDQKRADERIPDLLATPAAVRWISAEPLLGPVDLQRVTVPHPTYESVGAQLDALIGETFDLGDASISQHHRLDWVVVGGESGTGARPMHPDWARSLRDQCAAAGVPFFFKQWGEWLPEWDCGALPIKSSWTGERTVMGEGTQDVRYMIKVGKARAGRLLDGIEHNGMPGAP